MKTSNPQKVDGPWSLVHGREEKSDVTLFGLVLAGGKSSRMGHDKGLMKFYGRPQREHVFDILSKFCNKVFLSCRADTDIPKHLNPLADRFDMEGPLNGILTAFQLNSNCAWLTVPVDMPLIDENTIRYLVQHRNNQASATCFYDSDGKNPEPLVTLWEAKAYRALQEFHKRGMTSPRNFLLQADVTMIAAPHNRMLTNINSLDDLERFQSGSF